MSKDTCPTRPLAPATMVLLLASALITLTSCAHARDARDDWPEGSAMHTMYVVNEQLQISRAALNEAHARLLTALDDNADRPRPWLVPSPPSTKSGLRTAASTANSRAR